MSDTKRLKELRSKRRLARLKVKWFKRYFKTHTTTRRKRAAYMRATGAYYGADMAFTIEKASRPTRYELKLFNHAPRGWPYVIDNGWKFNA